MTRDELRALGLRATGDDPAAQRQLLAALYPVVRKHVGFLLSFSPGVEDAVQESMVAVFRSLPRYRGEANPVTWALTIATRTSRRHARRERPHVPPADPVLDDTVFDAGADPVEILGLASALATLSAKKREAFVLMALFELSASEAASVLGTFANTAASRYRHARDELRAILDTHAVGTVVLAEVPR